MKKCLSVVISFSVIWLVFSSQTARAISPFLRAFEAKYVKADSQDPKDVAFAEAVAAAKCNVCHAGATKAKRNPYGVELAILLDMETDGDNAEKIAQSLDAVAKKRVKPDDPKSLTFGDLIQQGKLPGGQPK